MSTPDDDALEPEVLPMPPSTTARGRRRASRPGRGGRRERRGAGHGPGRQGQWPLGAGLGALLGAVIGAVAEGLAEGVAQARAAPSPPKPLPEPAETP
ncbi:MAG: hypothetical protein R3F43_21695 [bacterium]